LHLENEETTMRITKPTALDELQRLSIVALPAVVITNVIILVMLSLIATDTPELKEAGIRIAPFVMVPPPPPDVRKDTPPVKPLEPLETPQWQPAEVSLDFDGPTTFINGPSDAIDLGKEKLEFNGGGGVVAYLKVEPVYPSRQLSRGIEGYVDLSFDITPAGSTTNIRVIASQPQGAFDKSAIDALKKWKYKVPLEAGIATGQRDMMTRISFAIDA
jgi:protein TonB